MQYVISIDMMYIGSGKLDRYPQSIHTLLHLFDQVHCTSLPTLLRNDICIGKFGGLVHVFNYIPRVSSFPSHIRLLHKVIDKPKVTQFYD